VWSLTADAQFTIFWQVRFALSGILSWRTVDGNFDYEAFWNNVVDFFENCPGPAAQGRVNKILKWWTRYGLFCGLRIQCLMSTVQENFWEKPLCRLDARRRIPYVHYSTG